MEILLQYYFYNMHLDFSFSKFHVQVHHYTCVTCSSICLLIDYGVLSFMCKMTLIIFPKTIVSTVNRVQINKVNLLFINSVFIKRY